MPAHKAKRRGKFLRLAALVWRGHTTQDTTGLSSHRKPLRTPRMHPVVDGNDLIQPCSSSTPRDCQVTVVLPPQLTICSTTRPLTHEIPFSNFCMAIPRAHYRLNLAQLEKLHLAHACH